MLYFESLCENAGNIIFRRNVGNGEFLGVDMFTNEMVLNVNMLDTCMEIDSRIVVA